MSLHFLYAVPTACWKPRVVFLRYFSKLCYFDRVSCLSAKYDKTLILELANKYAQNSKQTEKHNSDIKYTT